MPKFRKKPVVIEAVQVSNKEPAPVWLCNAFDTGAVRHNPDTGGVLIATLEGVMRAEMLGINSSAAGCELVTAGAPMKQRSA